VYQHIIHLNTQQNEDKSWISKNTILNKTTTLADTGVLLLKYEHGTINTYVHKSVTMLCVPIHQKKQRICCDHKQYHCIEFKIMICMSSEKVYKWTSDTYKWKIGQNLNSTSTTMRKCTYMILSWIRHRYLSEHVEWTNICNFISTLFFSYKIWIKFNNLHPNIAVRTLENNGTPFCLTWNRGVWANLYPYIWDLRVIWKLIGGWAV
jgi:hypothetical protein